MFNKILIANRGEIACRVIKTAHKMGVNCVAIYSEVDAQAMHVRLADEAVCVGPSESINSYLNIDNIIHAAQISGAEAIHPGYGFLSENPGLVEACEAAGLTFIGPSASSMLAMGLKDEAKKRMQKAGVPVVPGYHGENQDENFLADQADKIGYPVLIKARAGGGGKGMRRVDHANDFQSALDSAKRESAASFADDRVLIEKFVDHPRHIEIQIFADGWGDTVYLFERDCSLQRRHQKVVEEAPAPGMTQSMRVAMGEAAVNAATAVGYCGAGTVEFIVDSSEGLKTDRFYFMEMNTRLQVEHPVTEAICGLDLVEWQLRVAAGEPLPMAQSDLKITGHAVEVRVYAEDPENQFLPSTGVLRRVDFPAQMMRVDQGVSSGDEVSPYYDPMIAKLISHGANRSIALENMVAGLSNTFIIGCQTNVGFLKRLVAQRDFVAGHFDTSLIDTQIDQLITAKQPGLLDLALAADLYVMQQRKGRLVEAFRVWGQAERTLSLKHRGIEYDLVLTFLPDNTLSVRHGVEQVDIQQMKVDSRSVTYQAKGLTRRIAYQLEFGVISFLHMGEHFSFEFDTNTYHSQSDNDQRSDVKAPMPGSVIAISVQRLDQVEIGDELAVIEAMKMEHRLTATQSGVIAAVNVAVGDQVDAGQSLIRFESNEE